MDYARSLLEELMTPYEVSLQKKLTDDDICQDYIVSFCPHDLFVNTKADLGPCEFAHDDRLKKEYQEEKNKTKYDFESHFNSTVSRLVEEVDRKIFKAKERMDKPDDETISSKKAEVEEKIVIIDEKIKNLLTLAETAGEEGRISEAKSYSQQVEALEAELGRLKEGLDPEILLMGEKQMEVCDVCAALLVPGGEPKRTDAHNTGKMHTGYQKLREAYNEIKAKKAEADPLGGKYNYENSRYGRLSRPREYYDRDIEFGYNYDRRDSRDRSPRRRYSRDRSPGRRRYRD